MKKLLDSGVCRRALGAATAVFLLAGCASGGSLPGTGVVTGPGLSDVTTSLGGTSADGESIAPDTCNQFPLVCVKQGHSAKMGIKVTCKRGNKIVSCGRVTWFAKMSNGGLTRTFMPNPGNPTTETVRASKTIKVGQYYQLITAKCSLVANCPKNYKAPITVSR